MGVTRLYFKQTNVYIKNGWSNSGICQTMLKSDLVFGDVLQKFHFGSQPHGPRWFSVKIRLDIVNTYQRIFRGSVIVVDDTKNELILWRYAVQSSTMSWSTLQGCCVWGEFKLLECWDVLIWKICTFPYLVTFQERASHAKPLCSRDSQQNFM